MFNLLKYLMPLITKVLTGAISKFWAMSETLEVITISDSKKIFVDSLVVYAISCLPLLLAAGLVAVVFTFAQTRGLFSTKSMAFKMNRLNPIQGIKKLFSLRGLVELFKSILKIVVLCVIIYNTMKDNFLKIPLFFNMEPIQGAVFVGDLITSLVNSAGAVFVLLAVADYVYQWWEYEKNLRMSKDEIKEEYKQMEGDPQVKGKIKEKQRAMAQNRMMQQVPEADVIIRNPTHYAVAIKYDPQSSRAPKVIAKGMDSIALKIVSIAEESGITITENVPLARGLYAAVELDTEIPEQFYQPVAEVLAFVYSLKKKTPDKIITR